MTKFQRVIKDEKTGNEENVTISTDNKVMIETLENEGFKRVSESAPSKSDKTKE
jgi:hypothetical protein